MAKGCTKFDPSDIDVARMDKLCKRISVKELPIRVKQALRKVL